MRLLELGNLVKARLDVRDAAHRGRCASCTSSRAAGQPVDAPGRRDRLHRTHLQRALRHAGGARVGGRAPLHLTSVGKLFLAADDPRASGATPPAPAWPGTPATASPTWRCSSASWRWCGTTASARQRGAGAGRALHRRRHLRRPGQAGRRPVDLRAGGLGWRTAGSRCCARPRRRSPARWATGRRTTGTRRYAEAGAPCPGANRAGRPTRHRRSMSEALRLRELPRIRFEARRTRSRTASDPLRLESPPHRAGVPGAAQ